MMEGLKCDASNPRSYNMQVTWDWSLGLTDPWCRPVTDSEKWPECLGLETFLLFGAGLP